MERCFKRLFVSVLLALCIVFLPKANVYAGGTAGAICVKYVTYDQWGGTDYVDTRGQELTQTVKGPDGEGETYRWYDNNCFHYFILSDEKILHGPGTYTVTRADMPKGYELDVEMSKLVGMSVEVTQEDFDKYFEWIADGNAAGTEEYEIKVPVKKIGSKSALTSKPAKPRLNNSSDSTYLYAEGAEWRPDYNAISYEVQYATSKNGTYKKLCVIRNGTGANMAELNSIKHGKTYYMRARSIKTIKGKSYKSSWCTPKKIKVKKTEVENIIPEVMVHASGMDVTYHARDFEKIVIEYLAATSKKGKYSTVYTGTRISAEWSEFTKLKKEKDYYIKVRLKTKVDGKYVYSKYSKVIKVRRPKWS